MRRIILVLFLIISPLLFGQTQSHWEGSTALGLYGEFPASGFFGASNAFARNTVVKVENLTNGKTTEIIITSRLQDPGVFLLVSRDAASALGISGSEIVRCRVTVSGQGSKSIPYPSEERALNPDPDMNPQAGLSSELAFLESLLSPGRTETPAEAVKPEEPSTPPAEAGASSGEPAEEEKPVEEPAVQPEPAGEPEEQELVKEDSEVKSEEKSEEEPAGPALTEELPPEEPDLPKVDDLLLLTAEKEKALPEEINLPVPEPATIPEPVEETAPEIAETPTEEAALETALVEEPVAEESVAETPEEVTAEETAALPELIEPEEPEVLPEEESPVLTEALIPEPVIPDFTYEETLPPPERTALDEALPLTVSSAEELEEEEPAFRFDLEEPEGLEILSEVVPEEPEVLEVSAEEPEKGPEKVPEAEPALVELEFFFEPADERPPVLTPEEIAATEAAAAEATSETAVSETDLEITVTAAEEEMHGETPQEVSSAFSDLEVKEVTELPPAEEPKVSVPEPPKEIPLPILEVNKEAYYLQLGVYSMKDSALKLAENIGSVYPVGINFRETSGKRVYRVLVGPLNQDESGVVLLTLRSLGFKDAFIRHGANLE